ncbi:hypothetical protein VNI00_016925, partial [Paramarasmius palmivorus]
YMLCPPDKLSLMVESWLAQASGVFSQLRIREDSWEEYGVLNGIHLGFIRTSPYKEPIIPPKVYLFIRPIPRPSDEKAIWRSWMDSEKYFWSFDMSGKEMVPEPVQTHLGLPSFTFKVTSYQYTWSPSHYHAIRKLQISEGFDPTTSDFGLSLDLPIIEVTSGDNDRFEDFEGSSSLPLAGDHPEPRDTGERSTRGSDTKKPNTVIRTVRSTRANPKQQHRTDARKSTDKSPRKLQNYQDAQPASPVRANKRNLKMPGKFILRHRSPSRSATGSVQRASPFGKNPAPMIMSTKRATGQVGRTIDPSKLKQTGDHGRPDEKIKQPKSPSRQEDGKVKKPPWR